MKLFLAFMVWGGMAAALIVGLLYVVGLPATVFVILYRRRHKLFGDAKDPFVATTQSTFGFLYEVYGPSAWWWEVEELVRKLLLSAVVVLIEPGSPLQVCVCVRAQDDHAPQCVVTCGCFHDPHASPSNSLAASGDACHTPKT